MNCLAVFGWPKLCSLPCSLVWQVHTGKYLMYFDNRLIVISIQICICRGSSFLVLFWLKVGQKQKRKKIYLFFHFGGDKTNLNALFWSLHLDIFFFAFLLVSVSLIQGCKVKGTLSIKILVLSPLELEFRCLWKTKKIPKLRILYDLKKIKKFFKHI